MQGLALIAIGPDAIRAASDATSTVPIVNFRPGLVGRGLAVSLARPGGNITGVAILGPALDAKRLDLLHEALPAVHRVAALLFPAEPDRLSSEREMRAVAARTLSKSCHSKLVGLLTIRPHLPPCARPRRRPW
jgi:putative ABC transport system substrate-binding protein